MQLQCLISPKILWAMLRSSPMAASLNFPKDFNKAVFPLSLAQLDLLDLWM